jgi:hypothetical protein
MAADSATWAPLLPRLEAALFAGLGRLPPEAA